MCQLSQQHSVGDMGHVESPRWKVLRSDVVERRGALVRDARLWRGGQAACALSLAEPLRGLVMLSGRWRTRQAGWGAIWTMRSASRAAVMRSRRGIVGMTPPASRRDRAGWVMPARGARAAWDRPRASRRARTAW